MPSFAQNLDRTLHNALAHASERRHEYATLEHLLLALIDDEDGAQVMAACGVDLAELGEVVKQYLDQEYQSLKTDEDADPQPTAGFQRVIQRAILHVQSSGKDTVTGANVLVALFSERDSYAVYFLQQQDMSRLDAVSYISHGIGKGGRQLESKAEQGNEDAPAEGEQAKEAGSKKETALDQFTVNLNQKAEDGRIDPLIGRGPEVDRTVQILCRRSKNNPLSPTTSGRLEQSETMTGLPPANASATVLYAFSLSHTRPPSSITRIISLGALIFLSSTFKMTSPICNPARSPDDRFSTSVIITPSEVGRRR